MSYTKTNTFTAGNTILASQLETEFANIQTSLTGVTASGSKAQGRVLAGDGANFISTELVAGANITITPGAGTLTIAGTGGGGGVTSVDAAGGSTGMSFSGGPVTTSGTLTLAGTLIVANGGTGATTAQGARNALLPTQAGNNGRFLTTNGTDVSWAVVSGSTNLSIGSNTSTVVRVDSSTGDNATLPLATAALAGVMSATTQTFGGAKTFNSTVTATSFNATSSARYKENILDLTAGLEIIEMLRPVSFEWRDKSRDGRIHMGFIAEETETVIPEAVWQNEDGIADSISYQQIIPVLVNAIKQLSEEIRLLKGI